MSFQYAQLMLLLPAIIFCIVAWKVKPVKLKVAILLILVILALFNPLRFKQQGGSALEVFGNAELDVPERVTVEQPTFIEKQEAEMSKLKKESLEVRNGEID